MSIEISKIEIIIIKAFKKYDKVVLWFEHDLYDQLQILDWFHKNNQNETSIAMICVDQYLGRLTISEMKALQAIEAPVTEAQFALASKA